MSFREDRDILFDYCSCGKRKPISWYVCEKCYLKGHTATAIQAYGYRANNHPGVEIVFDPTGDFRKGAHFPAEQFGLAGAKKRSHLVTIDMGFWPIGMLVRHGGKVYTVTERGVVET